MLRHRRAHCKLLLDAKQPRQLLSVAFLIQLHLALIDPHLIPRSQRPKSWSR